jgi:hypothetical protein
MRLPRCLCVYVFPINFSMPEPNETRYAYHGAWGYLNDVIYESLPLVCLCMCVPYRC